MRVLFIHNKYGKYSGEEAVIEAQIKLLEDNGHSVLAFYQSSESIQNSIFKKVSAFFSGIYNPASIAKVVKILDSYKPDVVHIHNLYPFISPAIIPVIKKKGYRIVMTIHNYRLLCPNGLFYDNKSICEDCTKGLRELNCVIKNCERNITKSIGYALRNYAARINSYYLDGIDVFLCLSEFQRKKLIDNGFNSSRCIVIPNLYPFSVSSSSLSTKNTSRGVFVGRLNTQKGFDILVDAARIIPDIEIIVVGAKAMNEKLYCGLPNNIVLKGVLSKLEINDIYMSASFLIFCSRSYEGFPMVFLEAMANGMAIIAPNIGGFSEVVEDGYNGLLFEGGNSKDLGRCINRLSRNKHECMIMGRNNKRKLLSQYSTELYYNRLIECYTMSGTSIIK